MSYEVAQRLSVSERTARTHLLNLSRKKQIHRDYEFYDHQGAYRYFHNAPDPNRGGRIRQGSGVTQLEGPSPRQRAQQERARERDDCPQRVDPGVQARLRALSVDEQQWVEAPPEMRQLVLNVLAGVARLESSVRDALKPAKGKFDEALQDRVARHLLQPFLDWSRKQEARHKRHMGWVDKSTMYERAKGAQGPLVKVLDSARAEARLRAGRLYENRSWIAALLDKVNGVLETAELKPLAGGRLIQKLKDSTPREVALEILWHVTGLTIETLRRRLRFR